MGPALATARAHYRELDHHAAIAFTLLTELRDVMIVYYTTDLAERERVAAAAEQEVLLVHPHPEAEPHPDHVVGGQLAPRSRRDVRRRRTPAARAGGRT